MSNESAELMNFDEEERELAPVESAALAAITKSEVESQLDAAHKYRRSVTRFLQEAVSLATVSEDVAASCMYCLPRDGKQIVGPSARLAEICASAYCNLHVVVRIVAIDDASITAQGAAWDLEKNVKQGLEVRRKIVGKGGRRFSEDMINVTGMAALSIARRNAIFTVIPRAYVDRVFEHVKKVAVGGAQTIATRRATILDRLGKLGADQARVLSALGKTGVDDIGLEDLEKLIGMGTAIKQGEATVDELFPAPVKDVPWAPKEGSRMSLNTPAPAQASTPAAPATVPPKKRLKVLDADGNPIPDDEPKQ